MSLFAQPSCSDTAEDVVDPDMHGIGIIIAFVFTAALALLTAALAIVRGGIPTCYYTWLDEKILSILPASAKKDPKETPDNLGYQAFLLSLSDQTLLTGICYAITMYIRVCKLSVFSFQVGRCLIGISSTVHLSTLVVLKPHFLEHKCQATVRCGIMVFFLVLHIITVFLEARTWDYDLDSFFICTNEEQLSPLAAICSVTIALGTSLIYLNGVLSIKPRENKLTPRFWTTGPLKLIYERGDKKMDVKTYLLQKHTKATLVEQSKINALSQKPNCFKVVYIIVPILLLEIMDSIFFELLLAAVWFCYHTIDLCDHLLIEEEKVDTTKILSFGFGQIMPVLLLFVFAVTALEVGRIKQHHKAAIKGASLISETTPDLNATTESSTARRETPVQPDHSSGRASSATDNDEQDISQASYLHPDPNLSATDIASTTGSTRTDSLSRPLGAPSRANTLVLEEGKHQSTVYTSECLVHVIEAGTEYIPVATGFALSIGGLIFVGVVALSYKFIPWVDLTLVVLSLVLFFGELITDVMRVDQISVERRRNKDVDKTYPMDDLPAQNGSTGVDRGQPPVWRPSY